MYKIIKFLLIISFICLSTNSAEALLGEEKEEINYTKIDTTGFPDYPPFGEIDKDGHFSSMFDDFLKTFYEKHGYRIMYMVTPTNYYSTVQDVRAGKYDFIVGMMTETEVYKGIDFVYPAATINPLHIITLPARTDEIENISDLKNLKGAIHSNEHLSDHIKKQLSNFNIEYIDNSYALYEKLFKGEIDFIISSRYFAMIETAKLGIKNKIRFSKKPVWIIPIFFGISKSYEYRKDVNAILGKELKKPEVKEKINNYLIQFINNVERENAGIVPPTFVKD